MRIDDDSIGSNSLCSMSAVLSEQPRLLTWVPERLSSEFACTGMRLGVNYAIAAKLQPLAGILGRYGSVSSYCMKSLITAD